MTDKPAEQIVESAIDQLLENEVPVEQTEENEGSEEAQEVEEQSTEEDSDEVSVEDLEEKEEESTDAEDIKELREKKVKIGEDEFTIGELEAGFMRTKDYTNKTKALAEERKAYGEAVGVLKESGERLQEAYQSTEALFHAMRSSAEQEVAAIDKELSGVDWGSLDDTNFKYYQGLKNKRESVAKNYGNVVQRMQEIKGQYDVEVKKQKDEMVKVERKKLEEEYPVFKSKKGEAVRNALVDYLGAVYGEDANKVSENLVDHRDIKLLIKAYLYDEGQKTAKKGVVKKKAPVLKKSSTRGNEDDVKSRDIKNKRYRAKALGGRQNTAKLLETMI